MSWRRWADELRQAPQQAVADVLRGAADIGPFERAAPYELLRAVLPRDSRIVSRALLGEPLSASAELDQTADLPAYLDTGLSAWLVTQRQAPQPPARKLGAYAAQLCEALQWPLYFVLPQTRAALQANRAEWLKWLSSLTLSAYRDPEFDYWQVLASQQVDDELQLFWESFVVEAGRSRSERYLNLGLLALARLPLLEEDSMRNLRLQVQALINRYQRRKGWGTPALNDLAEALRSVITRNPSLNGAHYRVFLTALLSPLGDDKAASVLSLLGLSSVPTTQRNDSTIHAAAYKLKPPGLGKDTSQAVEAVGRSGSLSQAWQAIRPLLSAHEDFMRKSGDAYYFVRTLDMCVRALCEKYILNDQEIQGRLFQWIHMALRVEADDPRRWMLWELALRRAGHPQRAQWVLWEMTRRFPDNLPCRVELARLLAESNTPGDQAQAHRLLQRVLELDPDNLHAHSTLAQLAIHREDWPQALAHAQQGLRIDPRDAHSAVLLAAAYARRNGPDDLQSAVDHLTRFVARYTGEVKAESYLRDLLKRQELAAQGQQPAHEKDKEPKTNTPGLETDPAWRAFAESIGSWVATLTSGDSPVPNRDDQLLDDRVLPLPQALRQVVVQRRWDADVLDRYDTAAQREFPMETRLWRYLQTLQSTSSSESDRERAKQSLQAWLEVETQAPSQDSPSWVPYLKNQWEALNLGTDTALSSGTEWLKDLLDRYQPLPAPLFV
jgi:cytochrome c-type biogenesis protein CcmH/NrfG